MESYTLKNEEEKTISQHSTLANAERAKEIYERNTRIKAKIFQETSTATRSNGLLCIKKIGIPKT